MWRRLHRASIWHEDAIPTGEWKYRSLKRVFLPVLDALMIAGGVYVVVVGVPSLDHIFSHLLVDVLGGVLAGVATVCAVGAIFPRFYAVEIAGKVVLVGILGAYAAALGILALSGEKTGFTALVTAVAILLPMFRLTLLGAEIAERRAGEAP